MSRKFDLTLPEYKLFELHKLRNTMELWSNYPDSDLHVTLGGATVTMQQVNPDRMYVCTNTSTRYEWWSIQDTIDLITSEIKELTK